MAGSNPAGSGSAAVADLIIDPNIEDHQLGKGDLDLAQREVLFFKKASLDHSIKVRDQELGKVGKFFGAGSTAATNIAGVVCVFCCIGFCVTFFVEVVDVQSVRSTLASIITGSLGYVFGSNSDRSKNDK